MNERTNERTNESINRSPKLSVVIPVYNVEQYLPETIDSIITQDFDDFEAIFVDDASPDSCPALLDSAQEKYPNKIRVIHLPQNRGVVFARKAGVLKAKGKYLTFLDSDDYFLPDALSAMVNEMEKRQCDILRFKHIVVADSPAVKPQVDATNAHLNNQPLARLPIESQHNAGEFYEQIFIKMQAPVVLWAAVYPMPFIKKVYAETTDLNITGPEDIYTSMLIAYFAKRLEFAPQKVMAYRIMKRQITEAGNRRLFKTLKNIQIALNEFAQKYPVPPAFFIAADNIPGQVLYGQILLIQKNWRDLAREIGGENNAIYKVACDCFLIGPVTRAEKLGRLILFPFKKIRALVWKIEKNPIGKILMKPLHWGWDIFYNLGRTLYRCLKKML